MLSAVMRRPASILGCALATTALAGALGACGDEEPSGVAGTSLVAAEAVEGEPLELASLGYNVGITRFLNPEDTEDEEYLVGLPAAETGTAYLGVFLRIENHTDIERPSAHQYMVFDTLGDEYEALEEIESPYALEIGAVVPAEGELPAPNTTAQTGPINGALLVFLVDDTVNENRPLKLEVASYAGSGEIILDI